MKQKKITPKKTSAKKQKQPSAKATRSRRGVVRFDFFSAKVMILSGLVVALMIGGVGAWKVYETSATTKAYTGKRIGDPVKCTTNGKTVFNYLVKLGISKNGAAGILGNLWVESDVLPTKLQGTGTATYTVTTAKRGYGKLGYGIAQWTFPSRQKALETFAKKRNAPVYTLDTQMAFLFNELANSYYGTYKAMRASNDYASASKTFMLNYEQPDNQGSAAQAERAYNAGYLLSCFK